MQSYILFDLDGTLTDPREGITRSVQYALSRLGIMEDCDHLLNFIGPPLADTFAECYGFDKEQCARAINYYRERFSTIGLYENKVYPRIPEVLAALKEAGKRLMIATSKPTVFSQRICDKFGLSGYFDDIVGSELDGTRVYKDEVIFEALSRFCCDPRQAIMVGDREYDIQGAKKCGLQSVGVRYGYAQDGELQRAGAEYIVNMPEDLLFLCK